MGCNFRGFEDTILSHLLPGLTHSKTQIMRILSVFPFERVYDRSHR